MSRANADRASPRRRLIGVAAVVVALATLVRAAPATTPPAWPMYARDSRHSGYAAVNAPSSLPDSAWRFELNVEASDNASPVVGPDGAIYVPSRLGFFALNPNGTLKWKRWGANAFDLTLTGTAPAVAGDGTVYVIKVSDPTDPIWPDDALYALDPDDGSTLWRFVIGRATYGSPTIGPDGTIYVGSAKSGVSNVVFAVNPNGTQKWQWNSGRSEWIESSPALGPNGEVYVVHNGLGLVALDSHGTKQWNRADLGDAWNSPSVGPDGTAYVADSPDFYAVDARDGSTRWKVDTPNFMYMASASVSADGATIYRGDNGGIFYAFRSSGSLKWQFDTGMRGPITAAPAVAGNGVVYFTQDWSSALGPGAKGYVYALRSADGLLLWKREIGFSTHSPALAADGTLYTLGRGASGDELQAFGCGADVGGNGIGDNCEEAIPPETTIGSGPAGPTNDPTPTFTFSASEPASFECRVDGAAFAACASPHTTAPLADGAHSFQVRATDSARNVGSTATRDIVVDTRAPVTAIRSGPSGPTTDSTPTFVFSADEPATFQCRVDGTAFAGCSSPHTTAILALGSHRFEVLAADIVGNVDATPASRAFTVAARAKTTVGVVSTTVRVTRRHVAPIRLRCGGPTACRGTITLKATVAARLLGSTGKPRTITLGQRAFTIPSGRTAIVNVKLNLRGFRLLLRVKRLPAKARVSYRQATGTTTVTRAITLKAPKR